MVKIARNPVWLLQIPSVEWLVQIKYFCDSTSVLEGRKQRLIYPQMLAVDLWNNTQ